MVKIYTFKEIPRCVLLCSLPNLQPLLLLCRLTRLQPERWLGSGSPSQFAVTEDSDLLRCALERIRQLEEEVKAKQDVQTQARPKQEHPDSPRDEDATPAAEDDQIVTPDGVPVTCLLIPTTQDL